MTKALLTPQEAQELREGLALYGVTSPNTFAHHVLGYWQSDWTQLTRQEAERLRAAARDANAPTVRLEHERLKHAEAHLTQADIEAKTRDLIGL